MNKIIIIVSVFLLFGCNQLDEPAPEWSKGYPVGNGRLGGMVLGCVPYERISVNHDMLWRQFWSYQDHKTASDIKKIRELTLQGEMG